MQEKNQRMLINRIWS